MERKFLIAATVLSCLTLVSCSAKTTAQKAGSSVVLSISPPAAQVLPGGSVQLRATVTGSSVTTVHWSISETSNAGSITADGLYTAPTTVGVYHVLATSDADPRAVGTVAVTVTATPALAVFVSPHQASVAAGGTLNFTAAVTGTSAGQSTAVTWSVQEGSPGGGTVTNGAYTAPSTTGTYHVVATSVADTSKKDTATVQVTPAGSVTPTSWLMGYWATWEWDWAANGPPSFDGTALTHVAVAHALTTASGGLTYGYRLSELAAGNTDRPMPGTATDLQRSKTLVSLIHGIGAKAVLMIGGSDDGNWLSATSDANRAAFVATIVSVLDQAGWDGVDLDWENSFGTGSPPSGYAQFAALARELRAARPGVYIGAPLNNWGAGSLAILLAPYADQVNVMTYDMSGTGTWYHSALASTASNGATGWDAARGIQNVLDAGVPASQVGIGVPFYAYTYAGNATAPGQGGGGRTQVTYHDAMSRLAGGASYGTYAFDGGTFCPELYTGTEWLGYEDEASIAAKAHWARAKGLGGAIVWLLEDAAFPNGAIRRNPLLDGMKRNFLGRGPAPTPRAGAVSFSTGGGSGAGTVTISGLTRAMVWWDRQANASGFDLDANPANAGWSSGIPTAYVLEASSNGGTSWTTLATVTGNTYVTRLHAVDLTGMNRVRMRLTAATHDGTDGTVDLAVHDASQSNGDDSWLFIGDSITSNVFDGVLGNGRFGAIVNGRDPTRWPVALNGGIDGGVISEVLRTDAPSATGIPLIRKWMRDLPVKYVSLGIGTNDVNSIASWRDVTPADLDGWQAAYEQMIKEVIASGKTVVLPLMRWTNTWPRTGPIIAAWNNRILTAIAPKYPSAIVGPDLYTNSANHPELLTDGTHLTSDGTAVTQTDWANWAATAIYAPPAP